MNRTMAEVLTEHAYGESPISGFTSCLCGTWDHQTEHAIHVAAILTAAGFGYVRVAA